MPGNVILPGILFIRSQAEGAIPNGRLVRKVRSQPGDAHLDGALARVVGSVEMGGEYGYFVEWESHPGLPVAIRGSRIAEVPE